MDPETFIQFHVQGRTVTRDFKRTVREMVQLPPLRKFYCERFGWNDNIFGYILTCIQEAHIITGSTVATQILHKEIAYRRKNT
jgi:hypothetical protein